MFDFFKDKNNYNFVIKDLAQSKLKNRIKELREQKGYNQTEFAKRIGMSRTFLSLVEDGKKKLSRKFILKICEELKIDENQLFTPEEKYVIKDEYLEDVMKIIDDTVDSSDISKEERVDWISKVYRMLFDILESKSPKDELARIKRNHLINTKMISNALSYLEKKLNL